MIVVLKFWGNMYGPGPRRVSGQGVNLGGAGYFLGKSCPGRWLK